MQNNRPQKICTQHRRDDTNSPLSARRQKSAFITQRYASGSYQKMLQAFSELNGYIDILDEKIQKVLQLREGEFMIAYRNHVKKVRQQMDEIRKKSQNNTNSAVTQTERIEILQKQLSVFRQQSLRLFDKLTEKQKQLQQANLKISEFQTQAKFNKENMKALMKRNKILESLSLQSKLPSHPSDLIDQSKSRNSFHITQTKRPFTTAYNTRHFRFSKSRNNDSAKNQLSKNTHNTTQQSPQDLFAQIREIIGLQHMQNAQKIIKLLQDSQTFRDNNRTQKYQSFKKNQYNRRLSKEVCTSFQSQSFAVKSQMQQFFYSCIESVRKEICRRNQYKSLNFYNYNIMSLNDFRTLDHLRLMQIIVSHQQIIKAVYQTIFSNKMVKK